MGVVLKINKVERRTLRDLREENQKSRAEIAQALGVTLRAVYNYEYGIRQINISQVLILAEIYDIDTETVIRAALNSCL